MDVRVSYCGTTPVFQNVFIVITQDCPCTFNWTVANAWSQSCADGNWEVIFAGLPAGTYYLPVMYDAIQANGPYTISVTAVACPPPPPNDNCDAVTPMPVPATFVGNNSGATSDCALLGWPEAWEAFTLAECMDVTVDYCGTDPVFPSVSINLVTGCPCASTISPSSFGQNCEDGNFIIQFLRLAAGTYYLPIYSAVGSTGPYVIHVNGVACPPPPPNCPPAGESCADVIVVPACPFLCAGSTVDASQDYTIGCTFGGPDKIYQFTTWQTGDIHVDLCGIGTDFDTAIELRTDGDCPGNTVVLCNDDFCGTRSQLDVFAQPAGTYYLIVTGYAGHTGTYWLNLYTTPCFGCDAVTDLTVNHIPGGQNVRLRFTAPVSGNYQIWRTTVRNNDGNPDGGADPDWTLTDTVFSLAGFFVWMDSNSLVDYANYVVVHVCG
jgi:hypothetical protein